MKNIKLAVIGIVCLTLFGYIQSCSDNFGEIENHQEFLDNSFLEIEEYIIAGLDYQHALNIFNNEIKNIDFSKLSTCQDSKKNMVVNIPTSVSIEEKAKIFNEKKKLLLDKCPQIASFASRVRCDYFQQCIQKSSIVNEKTFELGIKINPRLKNWSYESYSNNSYIAYLDSQLSSSNYIEIVLIVFENGTAMTYIDSRNTSSECWYPTLYKKANNKWYVMINDSSPISYIAHTHRYSNMPSSHDLANSSSYPGLDERIYTSGGNTREY